MPSLSDAFLRTPLPRGCLSVVCSHVVIENDLPVSRRACRLRLFSGLPQDNELLEIVGPLGVFDGVKIGCPGGRTRFAIGCHRLDKFPFLQRVPRSPRLLLGSGIMRAARLPKNNCRTSFSPPRHQGLAITKNGVAIASKGVAVVILPGGKIYAGRRDAVSAEPATNRLAPELPGSGRSHFLRHQCSHLPCTRSKLGGYATRVAVLLHSYQPESHE